MRIRSAGSGCWEPDGRGRISRGSTISRQWRQTDDHHASSRPADGLTFKSVPCNARRRSQVVRQRTANPLFVGSIPTGASLWNRESSRPPPLATCAGECAGVAAPGRVHSCQFVRDHPALRRAPAVEDVGGISRATSRKVASVRLGPLLTGAGRSTPPATEMAAERLWAGISEEGSTAPGHRGREMGLLSSRLPAAWSRIYTVDRSARCHAVSREPHCRSCFPHARIPPREADAC